MPNEANKSKDKTGIVHKKKKPTMPNKSQGTEGHAAKDSNGSNAQKGNSTKSKSSDGESQGD